MNNRTVKKAVTQSSHQERVSEQLSRSWSLFVIQVKAFLQKFSQLGASIVHSARFQVQFQVLFGVLERPFLFGCLVDLLVKLLSEVWHFTRHHLEDYAPKGPYVNFGV